MRANSDWQVSDFEVQGADITGAYIYIGPPMDQYVFIFCCTDLYCFHWVIFIRVFWLINIICKLTGVITALQSSIEKLLTILANSVKTKHCLK